MSEGMSAGAAAYLASKQGKAAGGEGSSGVGGVEPDHHAAPKSFKFDAAVEAETVHRESIAEAEVASADDVRSLAAHARAEMVIQQQLSQKGAKNVEAVEMKNTEAAEKVAALLPKIKAAATFDELEKLLKEPAVIATTSRRADAVQRCMGYCKLARLKELSKDDGEVMLQGWAVSSFNEWNVKQERVLVLSTKYLYRVEFKDDLDSPVGGTPVKFAAVDLGVLTSLDEGVDNNAGILKVSTSERDGNPNLLDGIAKLGLAKPKHEREYDLRDYKHSAKETIVPLVIASIVAAHRIMGGYGELPVTRADKQVV